MNKKLIILLIAATIGIMTSCETATQNTTKAETRKVVDFTTIEGVKSSIDGTVWTYTEPLTTSFKLWMRLEFKGGKAYLYTAAPADGTWGKATVDNYTVKESRDINTGKRQVVVEIGSKQFVPQTGYFVYPMIQNCTLKRCDFSWD